MTDTDIVTELRQRHANVTGNDARISTPMSGPSIFSQAADEIERLREELTASHESHGNEVGALTERLSLAIHERDEARRLYCIAFQEITENLGEKNTTESIAEEMGWDCFKEEKQ